ncbi:hypothetical protein MRS44_009756 [Fusarium solani]|uniref:uncharacterized protein n=1 Tax=Fusarium solani TaxID=169388 RepID=UPI00230D9FDA|nr:hypothetical protein MRS44_009756 [Fusarium solani]KAJ4206467.1 hypothetical protein NW759_014253 [Fusarium solani]
MDSDDDIRKRFPISSYSDERAAIALETRPPLRLTGGGNSGLDCLIIVLRRIYSHSMLGPNGLATKEWFSPAESENPILAHAWHMFGKGKEEKERALEAKVVLIRSLQDMGMIGMESFCELDRSTLMARTFWGQDEMVLFSPRFDVRTLELLPCTKQEKGEKSLVKVYHQIGVQTLQGRFEELFGDYTEGDQCIMSLPARPEIIRVEYRPAEDPNDRPPFHSFRLVDFPAWTFHDTNDDPYFAMAGRVPYTLIAVVRHRDEPTGKDSVRTYSANGANIVPEYEPREYTPGKWSLEDAEPHTYTLFYGRSHPNMLPLPPLPELDNRVVNFDLWKRVNKTLKNESSAKKTQTAGGPSRQEAETAPPQREPPATGHDRQSQGGPEQQASHQGSRKDRHEASGKGESREASRKESREPKRKDSRQPKRKHGDDDSAQADRRKTRSRS